MFDSGQISTAILVVAGFVTYLTSQLQQRAKENRVEVKKLRRENGLAFQYIYSLESSNNRRGIKNPKHPEGWLEAFGDEEEEKASK